MKTTNPTIHTALKPIPQSTARTGWELCEEIKRAFREEYKRVNMDCVVATRTPERGGPACGTIGCFAGWGLMLRGVPIVGGIDVRMGDRTVYFSVGIEKLLGKQQYHCVGPAQEWVFNIGYGDDCDRTRPGTRAHARAVIRRINHFMQVNEATLKTRILPPLGSLVGGGTIVPDETGAPVGC